jgi:hypothetical protein
MLKHYGIAVEEDRYELIAFLNGGELPPGTVEKENSSKTWYFCFSVDSEKKELKVLKHPIREYYSLWRDEYSTKNDRELLI